MKDLAWLTCLLLLLALLPFVAGCDCGDDDDDDDGKTPADDDDTVDDDDSNSDDDTVDDDDVIDDDDTDDDDADDDDTDDDDTDDDTVDDDDSIVTRLVGGEYGHDGAPIAIADDGTIYVVSDHARELVLFTITDDKAISEEVIVRNGEGPRMRMDGNGNLHIMYRNLEGYNLALLENSSGQWVKTVPTLENPDIDDWYWAFNIDNDGNAHIAYANDDDFNLRYATNASGSWVNQHVDDESGTGYHISLAVDDQGHAHIAYTDFSEPDLLYATNASSTWTTSTIETGDDMGEYSDMAIDSNGVLHVVYIDGQNDDVRYATNSGSSWVPEAAVVGYYSGVCRIAIDSNNKPHILIREGTGPMQYAEKTGATWQTETVYSGSAGGRYFALDGDNTPVATLANYNDDELQLWDNSTGSWSNRETLAADFVQDGQFSLLADDQESTHFLIGYGQDRQLTHYTDATGSFVPDVIDASTSPHNVSMVWDSNGAIHAVYRDSTGLQYATNESGLWHIENIDGFDGMMGYGAELKIDMSDNLYVAYLDWTNNWLKFAVNETGSWDVSVIDAGPVSIYTDMAIAPDGTLTVAYALASYEMRMVSKKVGGWNPISVDPAHHLSGYLLVEADSQGDRHFITADYGDNLVTYGTDKSGSWVYQTIMEEDGYEFDSHGDMAIASDDSVHALIVREDSDSGDMSGIYYVHNDGGTWTNTVIDPGWLAGEDIRMTISSAGNIHAAYNGEEALWFTVFPLGYDGTVR